MKDFLKTVIPLGKTITKKMIRTFIPRNYHFQKETKNKITANSITKRYQDRLNNTLTGNENVQQMVDHILESLMNLINRYNLTNETNKKEIFDQIIIFMNNLYIQLRSKYLFSTLTNNNLQDFNEKTIGDKVNNLLQKEGKYSKHGCCCIHYALLFKQIFDEIEKRIKLGISNYLFLEKTEGVNHAGLVVTFQGQNYLVDSTCFNNKVMQPINELGENYDRMESLANYHSEDIPSDYIQGAKDKYIGHDDNYYKVALKNSDDLLTVYDSASAKFGTIPRIYNVFNKNMGINFRISNKGILILNTFVYYFDHSFSKEELDNISDNELMNYLADSISYKTKKDDDNKIYVFNPEKKYIRDTLLYFSDKVDYSVLRKILSNS